jgi:hypothetical protein
MAALRRFPTLEDLIDHAVTFPSGVARLQVDRIRGRYPAVTPRQVVRILERRYLVTVMSTGGAVGVAAALPAVGTGAAIMLTTSQAGAFLAASGALALAVADVHGVELDDLPRRRTLVLASLLGERGSVVLERELGIGSIFWARTLLTRLPLTTVRSVNKTLAKRATRFAGTGGAALALGRLSPFGIGAVIGATGARALGGTMIQGVGRAFGPAPAEFSRPGPLAAAEMPTSYPALTDASTT